MLCLCREHLLYTPTGLDCWADDVASPLDLTRETIDWLAERYVVLADGATAYVAYVRAGRRAYTLVRVEADGLCDVGASAGYRLPVARRAVRLPRAGRLPRRAARLRLPSELGAILAGTDQAACPHWTMPAGWTSRAWFAAPVPAPGGPWGEAAAYRLPEGLYLRWADGSTRLAWRARAVYACAGWLVRQRQGDVWVLDDHDHAVDEEAWRLQPADRRIVLGHHEIIGAGLASARCTHHHHPLASRVVVRVPPGAQARVAHAAHPTLIVQGPGYIVRAPGATNPWADALSG